MDPRFSSGVAFFAYITLGIWALLQTLVGTPVLGR